MFLPPHAEIIGSMTYALSSIVVLSPNPYTYKPSKTYLPGSFLCFEDLYLVNDYGAPMLLKAN